MTIRWPIHPAPTMGEALSSWLARIAHALHADDDMLLHDLGYHLPNLSPYQARIDIEPPMGLVEQLSQRTGVVVERIRAMTLTGFSPWLVDSPDAIPGGFATYTRQLSILLPPGQRRDRDVPGWRAWLPPDGARRGRVCPGCIPDAVPPHPYRLAWSIPLMLSCPTHRLLLRPHRDPPGRYRHEDKDKVMASAAVQTMDAWSWQALTAGHVDLERRRVHAGIWFRLLRTLLDELGATAAECGSYQDVTRHVWNATGQPVRAGQQNWRPYEDLSPEIQDLTLVAAAGAIALIRAGTLEPQGADARLLQAESGATIDPGELRAPAPPPGRPSPQEEFLQDLHRARQDRRRPSISST